jgi:hypothetical protein
MVDRSIPKKEKVWILYMEFESPNSWIQVFMESAKYHWVDACGKAHPEEGAM